MALSLVCTGALSLPLAKQSANPFWLMSRSISVLGVMERFEALISALLALGFCCLLALLLLAGRKALRGARPSTSVSLAVWLTAGVSGALLWVAPRVPNSFYLYGDLLFWGLLPILTLGIVSVKKSEKIEKSS